MTIREFIKENKSELNLAIAHALGHDKCSIDCPEPSIEECRMWILNDEGLYNWAKSSGVRI